MPPETDPHEPAETRTAGSRFLSKKVCLLGDFAVGKTSLVRRFVYDRFDDHYISTIGVKVSRKSVVIPDDDQLVDLTLMLWDLAGSEEFNRVRASYLRGAAGAVLVCDLTRPATLAGLADQASALRSVSPGARIVVAANKVDLTSEHQVSPEQASAAASALGAALLFTSAKRGDEVERLFRQLGQLVVAG